MNTKKNVTANVPTEDDTQRAIRVARERIAGTLAAMKVLLGDATKDLAFLAARYQDEKSSSVHDRAEDVSCTLDEMISILTEAK